MFGFFFSYGWRAWREITRVNADLVTVHREIAASRQVIQQLEERVERQALVLRALCTTLREHGITEQVLLERVGDIGDQTKDARPKTCAKCGKELRQMRDRCIYCGTQCPAQFALESL
jgi:hypothetical protein